MLYILEQLLVRPSLAQLKDYELAVSVSGTRT